MITYVTRSTEERIEWRTAGVLTRLRQVDGYVRASCGQGYVRVQANLPGSVPPAHVELALLDREGNKVRLEHGELQSGQRLFLAYWARWPDQPPPAAILLRQVTETYEATVPFRFEGVPIR